MSDTYSDFAPFDQTADEPNAGPDPDLEDCASAPTAFYGEDSGLIHMFINCAERLTATYQNMDPEYEPPSAEIDVTPENALKLRDGLTKSLAAWRKDIKEYPP